MDEIISMFIDNELSIDGKMSFVKRLEADPEFSGETLALLEQEKLLRTEGLYPAPAPLPAVKAPGRLQMLLKDFFRPLVVPVGAMAVLVIVAAGVFLTHRPVPAPSPGVCQSRLVVYRPDAREVAVAGAFTDWEAVAMHAAGASGYWEIRLDIPRGEHRFVYIADGHRRFVDPTILTREKDDFGGENSILIVGQSI